MSTKTIVGLLLLGVVIIGGVYVFSAEPKHEGPIKVGFIGPLTGDVSSIGTVARAAVEVAVDEINAAGGIDGNQLEIIYEDGKCDAAAANSAANKLINIDKVTAIIGGACSGETLSFVQQAMEKKVVTISYCSSVPTLSGVGKYFFRDYPSDAYQGVFMADYAYNKLGARNVSILYHINDAHTSLKDVFTKRFTELGGRIDIVEGTPQEARDYRTQLTKMGKAAFIYMPTYADGATVALTQAHELGIKATIFSNDAWGDPKMQEAVAGLDRYAYSEAKTPEFPNEFVTKVQEKAGTDSVPACAPQAYDATHILAGALRNAGTNPDKVADALRVTRYDGVSGHIEFDENGDLKGAAYVVKMIQNGTATEVK
ncbi:MAG: ABC transporter substrate-binding protein [Patescibacteria group bacterium]